MTGTYILDRYPIEHGSREGQSIIMLHGGNMAGWTWDLQIQALSNRHILTPDLPGYGRHAKELWPGAQGAADRIADLIHQHAIGGRAHLVGLSLGGFVAIEILRRHPEVAHSCIISGSTLAGTSRIFQAIIAAQVPLWTKPWYWRLQAASFNIPPEDRELFIQTTTAPLPRSNRAMARETLTGICPLEGLHFEGPVLAVAAEHDFPGVRKGYETLKKDIPQLQTWIAPGVHHPWSVEKPELFTQMVRTFVDTGRWQG